MGAARQSSQRLLFGSPPEADASSLRARVPSL